MAEDSGSSGVNALAIVAILAILVGIGIAVWFIIGRGGAGTDTKDINVKLDNSAIESPYTPIA